MASRILPLFFLLFLSPQTTNCDLWHRICYLAIWKKARSGKKVESELRAIKKERILLAVNSIAALNIPIVALFRIRGAGLIFPN
jgi:hypothetical protein